MMFPFEEFKPNPTMLMITILKLKQEITMTNLPDAFSLSLGSSDAMKNFGKDISQIYLPYSENRNPHIEKSLKTLKGSLGGDEIVSALII